MVDTNWSLVYDRELAAYKRLEQLMRTMVYSSGPYTVRITTSEGMTVEVEEIRRTLEEITDARKAGKI